MDQQNLGACGLQNAKFSCSEFFMKYSITLYVNSFYVLVD